ncbi:hypothetical protein D3C84_1274060 [compost metagenome]
MGTGSAVLPGERVQFDPWHVERAIGEGAGVGRFVCGDTYGIKQREHGLGLPGAIETMAR